MSKQVKIFPLRLHPDKHAAIKAAAENEGKSMHQFVLDSTLNNSEAYDLILASYNYIKGGPAQELEEMLFEWLLKNK